MTFDPRSEIGEDYSGESRRHHQYNETHEFTNDASTRIFMPNLGSFYVKSLVVIDIATGRSLTKGVDYNCSILDDVATEKSGLEVCGIIEVINLDVTGVIIEYQHVGGLHTTGYYILRHLIRMYPNGINSVLEWDNILNKPELHDPSFHMHHVRELFNSNTLVVWLERIRCAVVESYSGNFKNIYDLAEERINTLYNTLDTQYEAIKQEILDIFNRLKIQGEEYIFTDNPTNPAVERGYGDWQLVTNAVLYGASSAFIIGTGLLMSMDSEQVIRNTYIWKNISTKIQPQMYITSDKDSLSEGEDITFTLNTTDIPVGTVFQWIIQGADALDIVGGVASGSFAVNAQGQATKTISFAKDRRTEGTKSYSFVLRNAPQVKKDFVVLDTSTLKLVTMVFQKNGLPISEGSEDDEFDLVITTKGYANEELLLQWAGLASTDFVTPPPTSVIVGTTPTIIKVKTLGNIIVNGDRTLTVNARDVITDPIVATTKLYIRDTSTSMQGKISFLSNNLVTTQVNEGSKFKVRLRTNGGRGKTVQLTYTSNKRLSEFLGLIPTAVIDENNTVEFEVEHLENNATATVLEWLQVEAKYLGVSLDTETLAFRDTSKTPNYQSYFSSDVNGENEITSIDEGLKFYFIMKVPNWIPSQTPPMNDYNYLFDDSIKTLTEMRTRITGGYYSQLTFDGTNTGKPDVRWINNSLLSIEFTAVADNKVGGDLDFKIQVKPTAVETWEVERTIRVNDTSRPTVTTQWSSSASTLVPITNINEMTSNGLDNTAYLWISSGGDARPYGDLTLDLSGNIQDEDIVTDFPVVTKFTALGQTLKIPVVIKADFRSEGEEYFTLTTSYVSNKGTKRDIASSSLTINDNSQELPLVLDMTAVQGDLANGFSEWKPITFTATSMSLAFVTNLALIITYEDGSDASERFQSVGVTGPWAANNVTGTLVITPKMNRQIYTNNNFQLTAVRTLADGTVISQETILKFKMKNDGTPPNLKVEMFSDIGRTNKVTSIDEGKTYYGRATLTNPNPKTILVLNNPFPVETTKAQGDKFTGRDQPFVVYSDSNKVLRVLDAATEFTEIKHDFVITLINDRATNLSGATRWLRLVAIGDMVNTNVTVGTPYPTNDVGIGDPSYLRNALDLPINDTSKTMIGTLSYFDENGNARTSFDEGEIMKVRLNYTNATIGDEYFLSIRDTSLVKLNRFEMHDFGSKKVTTAYNGSMEWMFKFLANRLDNGNQVLDLDFTNDTAAIVYKPTNGITLNDTSKTPNMFTGWYANGSTLPTSQVNEGDTIKLTVRLDNVDPAETVKVDLIDGRPLSDFESNEFGVFKSMTLQGAYYYAEFNFKLKNNHQNDTINFIKVKITPSTAPVDRELNLTVNDTSRTPGIISYEWRDLSSGGNIITSIDEGKNAYLQVYTAGGSDRYDLRCENMDGRDPARLQLNQYNLTRQRASDTNPVYWGFGPRLDGETNAGNNTRIKVKVYMVDDPSQFIIAELPINDVSQDTTGLIVTKQRNGDGSFTTVLDRDEGQDVYPFFTLYGTRIGGRYRIRATTTHAIDSSTGFASSSSNQWYTDITTPTYQETYEISGYSLKIKADNKTGPASELYIDFDIIDLDTNRIVASNHMPINDTSRYPPEYTIKLVSTNDVNGPVVNSVVEGNKVYVVVTSKYHTGNFLVRWVGPVGSADGSGIWLVPQTEFTLNATDYWGQTFIFEFQTNKDEADNSNGGVGYLGVQRISGINDATAPLTIIESSPLPRILSTYWAWDADGVNVASPYQVNEGDTIYYIIKTVGVMPDNPINISWGGSTTNGADFTEGTTDTPASIYLRSYNPADFKGTASYKFVVKADQAAG